MSTLKIFEKYFQKLPKFAQRFFFNFMKIKTSVLKTSAKFWKNVKEFVKKYSKNSADMPYMSLKIFDCNFHKNF